MKYLRFIILALAFACHSPAALAQWQVPDHAVPIGRGGASTGFKYAVPGTAGFPLVSGGVSADPIFQALGTSGLQNDAVTTDKIAPNAVGNSDLAQMPANTIKCNPTGGSANAQDCNNSQFSSILTSANNTWTGDNFFGSGRPWCDVRAKGAVGDGATDDTPAFNACVTLLQGGGGIIFIPRSSAAYCLKTGVHIDTGNSSTGSIIIQGSNPISGSAVSSCGGNTAPVFTINNQWVQIKNLNVYGYGGLEDPFVTGMPTQPAILLGSGCSSCRIQDTYVTGGTAAIQSNGSCGYILDNVWASFSYGDNSHIFGVVNNINCGGLIVNSHIDMVWPVSQPAHGIASPIAWAAGAAITTGDLRTAVCAGRLWIIQASSTGTAGAGSPPCRRYGIAMTDGGVSWRLVTFVNSAAIFVDTGSVEMQIFQTDMTSATYFGFRQANSFAGLPPTQTMLTMSTPGGTLTQPISIEAGNGVTIVGTEVSYCAIAGCAGMLIQSGVSGIITASGMRFLNGLSYGAIISGGSNILFNNNIVSSADTYGVFINANVSHWSVSNNILGSGITGQSIGTAASATINYCIITNNIYHGATNPSLNLGAGACANITNTGNL